MELPSGIGSLANLRLLNISSTKIHCLPVWIKKLTKLQSLLGMLEVRRGGEQGGIEVMKDLVNLQGTIRIAGLSSLVNIEDARHKPEQLSLVWAHDRCFAVGALSLAVSPEETKDVAADEKWEKTILKHLQPHANLKCLRIDGYGRSKFPKWVGNPFSFASLEEISISDCKKIRFLPLYIHGALGKLDAFIQNEPPRSMLKRVSIGHCGQLTSMAGLHNLHSLERLDIFHCPQLRLLSEEGPPSKLSIVHIEHCKHLTSLSGGSKPCFSCRINCTILS